MRKELTMNPVQDWGEELEDGVIYNIKLKRVHILEPAIERAASSKLQTDERQVEGSRGIVQYKTCKIRTVKAATLEKLVEKLVRDSGEHDPTYINVFLSTYRAFASTQEVLELLLDSYSDFSQINRTADGEAQLLGPNQSVVQSLTTCLCLWLDQYRQDFQEPPHYTCLHKLITFLQQNLPHLKWDLQQAQDLLQQFQEQEASEPTAEDGCHHNVTFTSGGEEMDKGVGKADFLSFSSQAVAEQLTLMDVELFSAVSPFHCLGCIWSQRDKKECKHPAPTIRATIAQFNAVTNCVISTVLHNTQLWPYQRAKVIDKWIEIALECRTMKNFSSLRAILSALQSNPIYRLKRTWAAVSKENAVIFSQLSEIFSDDNNHLSCRELLSREGISISVSGKNSCNEPNRWSQKQHPPSEDSAVTQGMVPYLGTFLTDLTMLDTALPDYMEGSLINFEKRRREFEILAHIKQLQSTCTNYRLNQEAWFTRWFRSGGSLTEEQSYQMSQEIELLSDLHPSFPKSKDGMVKRLSLLFRGSEGISGSPGKLPNPKSNLDNVSVSSSRSTNSETEECTSGTQFSASPDRKLLVPSFPSSSYSSDVTCFRGPTPSRCHSDLSPQLSKNPKQHRPSSSISSSTSVPSPPVYNLQLAESCIVRVSVNISNGNIYKSILLTNQDKTPVVIQRALAKHHLESERPEQFQLAQIIAEGQELVIPDHANVFYAMNTAVNFNFILRKKATRFQNPDSAFTRAPKS
ncbi:ral guanine nucleotide dissociation stimulator-like 1 isoform X2 [Heptranchias perlo]|uniref:ral guanine nucleotide dissociation stimulator-like 1 isoform X2 n=1 Tax=Heptranchias perlo TaxID=212740 RepID=UPI003559FA4A